MRGKCIPNWPMNAVSTREAIGSAVRASAAGNAICAISKPSSSILKANLPIHFKEPSGKETKTTNLSIKSIRISRNKAGNTPLM